MSIYLQRWLKMAHIAETYEALFDLVLRDQFLNVCNRDLILFLKERMPKSIQDMAQLADQYREARMTNAVNLIRVKANGFQPPTVNHPGNPSDSSDKFQTCILADGSSIRVPVASIFIDTPYITETFEACCMGKPVYDLIIGNVGKVRPPGDPDTQWSETHAAEIRMQAEAKLKPRSQFKVPKISSKNITPKNKKVKQQTGDSLQKLCHVSTSGQEEDYKIDVKGKSKAFHVNMVTKYIDRNADPPNLNQDDEATVSSAVIDRPEDEDVEKYGLQSVEDKEELSRVDIIQELGPEDRQKIVGKDQLKAQSDKEKTIDKQTTNYDFIDIFYGPLKFAINEFFCNVNMLFIG
uniref:Uncharacterized protein n=1 Tax=Magallana gigas TaxID=29159 RepID=K1PG72_MAGGI